MAADMGSLDCLPDDSDDDIARKPVVDPRSKNFLVGKPREEDLVKVALHSQLRGLSGGQRRQIKSSGEAFKNRVGQSIKVATLFAGCELVVHALQLLSHVLKSLFEVPIDFVHEVSVEKDEWKHQFTDACGLRPRFQFADLLSLRENDWNGLEVHSNRQMPVPKDLIGVIAGFECDSVSNLHTRSAEFTTCCEAGEGKTGITCSAMLDFITHFKISWALLENVKNLGPKNMAHIVSFLNNRQYYVHTPILEADAYGAPCKRARQWFLVVNVGRDVDQMAEHFVPWPMVSAMDELITTMTTGPGVLHDYLFADDDPLIANWIADMRKERAATEALKEVAAEKKTRGKIARTKDSDCPCEKWETDHLLTFTDHSEPWPAQLGRYDSTFPERVDFLPKRQQEVAFFFTFVCKDARECKLETVHDLNMSLDWNVQSVNICCTIVCSSTIWLRQRRRLLHGEELLRMQGFPIHRLPSSRKWESKACTELAGNSFSGFVVFPAFLALLAGTDWESIPTEEPNVSDDLGGDDGLSMTGSDASDLPGGASSGDSAGARLAESLEDVMGEESQDDN